MKLFFLFLLLMVTGDIIAQNNVTFLSNLNPHPANGYANIWGYVAPNGTEYALLGAGTGTSIISLADPTNPVECAFIPAPQSLWRELKVYSHYLYVATDQTGNGLQIIDLSPLPDTAILVNTLNTYFNNAHDLLIDNGYCYVVGGDAGGGMSILSLANPVSPVRTAYYTASGYIHDIYIWNDTVVASCGYTQQYHLVNVTNKFSPQFISASPTLPGIYAHSGWMTENKRYFFGTDEFNVRDMTVWDLQDRSSWDLIVPSWGLSNSSIIHNLYIKGNYAHISYYTSGYVVLDISNPANPQIAGQYDTYPQNNNAIYNGAWGVYPYLPSGNIIVSDMTTGLYVLHFDGEVQTFQLSVDVGDKWNVLSIPGNHPDGNTPDNWWPFRDPTANVFYYNNGYQIADTLLPGKGYWIKHLGSRIYNTGDEWPASGIIQVPHSAINGVAGFNLIGGYENVASTSLITTIPSGLQSGPVYRYVPAQGYLIANTVDPGYGYWIKLISPGQIIIPESYDEKNKPENYFPDDWGRIVITDVTGVSYTLYAVNNEVDLNNYELPPAPMEGMFDIRFSSNRIAEDLSNESQTILMSGLEFPVKIKVLGVDIRIQDESEQKVNSMMRNGEEIIITDEIIKKLFVTENDIPDQFLLEQNYPNPFNPNTRIQFSIPENTGVVRLSIYNSLGEKITELVNKDLSAGNYQYEWNAKNQSSGLYFYELKTDKYVAVRKMILLK